MAYDDGAGGGGLGGGVVRGAVIDDDMGENGTGRTDGLPHDRGLVVQRHDQPGACERRGGRAARPLDLRRSIRHARIVARMWERYSSD